MARRSYMAETREEAYRAWRQCGQNVEMCLRELAKQGTTLTKPTIYEWMEKFGWKERAARAEAEEKKSAGVGELSFDEQMLQALISQREKYEQYFATLTTQPDNQATYAYTNLIKTISDIRDKVMKAKSQGRKATGADRKEGTLTDERAEEIRKKILGIV